MELFRIIKSDFKANGTNTKGKLITLSFRISSYFYQKKSNKIIYFSGIVFIVLHKVIVQWILGVDLPEKTKIGKSLCIYHGQGLTVNEETIFGDNITLRQNTTIGNKFDGGKSPTFGNNINIGANSVIIGEILIGDNVIIGAGSVVIKDVPSNSVVAGNPAKIIKTTNNL
jgi:putative colanic acid biosynthesis acetyltransferase WcaB